MLQWVEILDYMAAIAVGESTSKILFKQTAEVNRSSEKRKGNRKWEGHGFYYRIVFRPQASRLPSKT